LAVPSHDDNRKTGEDLVFESEVSNRPAKPRTDEAGKINRPLLAILRDFFVVDGLHRCGLSSSNAMGLSSAEEG
jgi:hypothetical protein